MFDMPIALRVSHKSINEYKILNSLLISFSRFNIGLLRETDYVEIIGGAEWPSRQFLESAYTMFMNSSDAPDDLTEEFMEDQVGRNLARVDVYYDTLNVESVIESRTYTVRRTWHEVDF